MVKSKTWGNCVVNLLNVTFDLNYWAIFTVRGSLFLGPGNNVLHEIWVWVTILNVYGKFGIIQNHYPTNKKLIEFFFLLVPYWDLAVDWKKTNLVHAYSDQNNSGSFKPLCGVKIYLCASGWFIVRWRWTGPTTFSALGKAVWWSVVVVLLNKNLYIGTNPAMFLNVKLMCIQRENYMWMKDLIVVYS